MYLWSFVTKEEAYTRYFCRLKQDNCLKEKYLCSCLGCQWNQLLFSWKAILFGRTADRLLLLRFGCLVDISTIQLQEKTTDSVCCQQKDLSFWTKIRILGNLYLPLWAWWLPILKRLFWWELVWFLILNNKVTQCL